MGRNAGQLGLEVPERTIERVAGSTRGERALQFEPAANAYSKALFDDALAGRAGSPEPAGGRA